MTPDAESQVTPGVSVPVARHRQKSYGRNDVARDFVLDRRRLTGATTVLRSTERSGGQEPGRHKPRPQLLSQITAFQCGPGPPDHHDPLRAECVLAQLLPDECTTRRLPRTQQPTVLLQTVELADEAGTNARSKLPATAMSTAVRSRRVTATPSTITISFGVNGPLWT